MEAGKRYEVSVIHSGGVYVFTANTHKRIEHVLKHVCGKADSFVIRDTRPNGAEQA